MRTILLPNHLVNEEVTIRRVTGAAGEYDARSVNHALVPEVSDWLSQQGIRHRHRQRKLVFFRDEDADLFRQRFWGQVIRFPQRTRPEAEIAEEIPSATPSPR